MHTVLCNKNGMPIWDILNQGILSFLLFRMGLTIVLICGLLPSQRKTNMLLYAPLPFSVYRGENSYIVFKILYRWSWGRRDADSCLLCCRSLVPIPSDPVFCCSATQPHAIWASQINSLVLIDSSKVLIALHDSVGERHPRAGYLCIPWSWLSANISELVLVPPQWQAAFPPLPFSVSGSNCIHLA